MVEVIVFNMATTERKVIKFDELYQAIGFIKSRRQQLASGEVLVLSDSAALSKYMPKMEG